MPTSRILLISNAPDTSVADALRASGHEITIAPDVPAAVAQGTVADSAEVMVLDLSASVADIVAACRVLRAAVGLTGLPILCVSSSDDIEDRIKLLEAGSDDVIARPFDVRELDARAEALALRLRRSRDLGPVRTDDLAIRDRSERRTITVFSPKGGAGTTTIAVNLATSLAAQVPGSTAILDLDFQFGQVATHLNLTPRLSLAELVRDDVTMRDPGLLTSALDGHGSGLRVLGAAATPDATVEVTAEAIGSILDAATAAFHFVVVDAGSVLDARTQAIFARTTDLIVVVTPEFPAIKAVHVLSEILAASNLTAEVSFVLNEIFARELLRLPDIEEALGTKVALILPYDAFAFLKSVNEGVPVVRGAPRTAAAERLSRFAARVAGLPTEHVAPERKAKGLAGLFSRT